MVPILCAGSLLRLCSLWGPTPKPLSPIASQGCVRPTCGVSSSRRHWRTGGTDWLKALCLWTWRDQAKPIGLVTATSATRTRLMVILQSSRARVESLELHEMSRKTKIASRHTRRSVPSYITGIQRIPRSHDLKHSRCTEKKLLLKGYESNCDTQRLGNSIQAGQGLWRYVCRYPLICTFKQQGLTEPFE